MGECILPRGYLPLGGVGVEGIHLGVGGVYVAAVACGLLVDGGAEEGVVDDLLEAAAEQSREQSGSDDYYYLRIIYFVIEWYYLGVFRTKLVR